MKVGVSSYSFEKYRKNTGADYLEICDISKKIGFDGIEFTELEIDGIDGCSDMIECALKIKEHCEKIGLKIINYAVGANLLSEDKDAEIEKLFEQVRVAKALGVSVMRHDVCFVLPQKPLYNYRDAIKEMVPSIRKVTEYAKAQGVRTCTENHGFIFQSPERVEELILAVGNENYGWLCDMGNFLCSDDDPIRAVAIAAPYAFHVHAKDFLFKSRGEGVKPEGFFETRGGNYLRGTVVGHGVVPIVNCISILKKAGYDGYISLEFEGAEDNMFALEAGYKYLRSVI
ncbi:MAG: sugar phosphate isomerase/epimerase [Clostridia bacterium]|nr:sugar phosphate isomerase/epimerase [Clostridia bacterium]